MKFRLQRFLTSRVFLASLAALLLYTCGGYFLAPHVIAWYIPKYLQEQYACQASIEKVRFNPFRLQAEVNDFRLNHPDGEPMGHFSRLVVDAQLAGLFRKAMHVRDIQLDRLSVNLIILPDGSLNVSALAPRPSPEKPDDNTPGSFDFLLDTLTFTNGEITVTDRRQATPASWTLNQINVQIQKLSTVEGENGSMALQAATSEGETLDWQGVLTLTPLQSHGQIHLKGIRIASIWKYLKDRIHLEKPEGTLDIQTGYRFDTKTTPASLGLANFQAEIREASLTQTGSEVPFSRINRFGIDSAQLDLASRALDIRKILLDGASFAISIDENGRSNLEKIFPTAPPPEGNQPKPETPPTEPPPVSPDDRPWTVTAHAVEITHTACEITDLSRVEPLTAGIYGITVRSQAAVEAGLRPWISLQDLTIELEGIHGGVQGASRPLMAAGKLMVTGGEFHSGHRALTIARVGLQDGHIDIGRNTDGSLNWERLLAQKPGGTVPPEPAPDAERPPPWQFRVQQVEVERFQSEITDQMAVGDRPLLCVQDLSLAVSDVDGPSPMTIRAGFSLEPGGKVSVEGQVHPAAPSAEARVDLSNVDITPIQPYLEPFTTLTIQSAMVSAKGVIHYEPPGKSPRISYAGNLGIANLRLNQPGSLETFLGWNSLTIPQLQLALDPEKLDINEIRLIEPTGQLVIAEDGTLNWSRIMRKPTVSQGSESSPPEAAPTPPPADAPSEPFSFRIGKITLEKGHMVFADQSLKPAFSTRIHDLRGSVGKLSSQKNSLSEIRLDGQVDEYGMAHISGALAVNNIAHSTDIRVKFRNVEMAGISPYSGKFAGRRIESGKISADLTYQIQTNKLVGDNQIVVDNLTLGERVDSPNAVNLPLDLAIALLADADGRMNLGLPVSGELNDPQFRIGPVIWKAFVNLITRVVTAPFRALGSLLGGGAENFETVEFEPGKAHLLPPEREKLKKISEALQKRPRLQLVVQGQYSPDIDGLVWKQMRVTRLVQQETGEQKQPVSPTEWEPMDFGDARIQQALQVLFEKKFGSQSLEELEQRVKQTAIKTRPDSEYPDRLDKQADHYRPSMGRMVTGAMVPEQADLLAMEMFDHLVKSDPLPDSELRRLADQRAHAVQKELRHVHVLPDTRLKINDSQAVTGQDGISAELSLNTLSVTNQEGTVDSISR